MGDRRIVLREYESLPEHELDGAFDELEEFVEDYRDQYGKTGVLTLGGSRNKRYFKPTHYVGLISLPGGLRIEILPKLFLTEGTNGTSEEAGLARDEADRNFFFTMLRTCGVIPSEPSSRGGLGRRHTDMLECFYAAFVEGVRRLVQQGLASGYHTESGNRPFLKGRLELAGHIKYNAAHRERFYVTYDVFDQDRAENRLIKTALAGVRKRTTSPDLRILAGRLLGDMDAVPFSQDPAEEFRRLVKDRSVARYGEVLEWARLFLLHESFTAFSGASATQAVLFPMERVFQDYVAAILQRSLTPLGWEVKAQNSRQFFCDEGSKVKFLLRPDLVLTHGRGENRRCFVMDAKWKNLDKGVSQADLYQMYAYGRIYAAERVTLIYPLSRNGKEFTFTSQEEKDPAKKENPVTVDVKQFRVDKIEKKLVDYVQGLLRNETE